MSFTRYVQWPAKSFKQTNSPVVIGIFGQDRFGQKLPALLAGQTVEGRELVLRKVTTLDECKESQILFVSQSEKRRVPKILRSLGVTPVLTVGESENFLQAGGMINFRWREGAVLLEINHVAAQKAGLQISSKLLLIADRSRQRL